MRRILLLVVMLVLLVGTSVPAYAHKQGFHSVNTSEQLIYTDGSSYNIPSEVSYLDSWDCYTAYAGQSCPGINLVQGNATSRWIAVSDYCKLNDIAVGYYRPATFQGYDVRGNSTWKGSIVINACFINQKYSGTYETYVRRMAINHEFLHSLGFAHTPVSAYYTGVSIMCPGCNPTKLRGYPGSHDWADYAGYWITGSTVTSP